MAEIFFHGQVGRIEGNFIAAEDKRAPVALVLHPHPLHQGTMNNKVVYETYKRFANAGFSVLRINFRGVGKSEGTFDNGVGEMIDASIALDWLLDHGRRHKMVWVAGFSFGAWIALQVVMRRPEVTNFISIAGPYHKYDFSFLSPCPVPGLLVHGDQDSVVPEEHVYDFIDRISKHKGAKIDCSIIPGADHFFRNKLNELGTAIDEYIQKYVDSSKSDFGLGIEDMLD